MSHLKLAAVVSFALLFGVLSASAVAQDEETEVKAKDTPYFSGMPDYQVFEAVDKKFDSYSFFNGKDATTVEGQKFFRFYTLKEGAEQASDLQITRNHVNAIKKMGGTVLFDGVCEGDQGAFLLCAGEAVTVDLPGAGRAAAEVLSGRGGGSGRIFQGKAAALSRRAEALARVRSLM